jgi:hypothetical protein
MSSPQKFSPPKPKTTTKSRQVVEHVRVILVPFQELSSDQVFDALFNRFEVRFEPFRELLHHFQHEFLVRQGFPGFHRPHHRGVDGVPAVVIDVRDCFRPVLHRRNGNFDSPRPVRELFVVREHVVWADLLVFRGF